ncbi:MAG: NAD-dependent epimerase/dehydratase family protein [Phycisphaerales bacterium]
MKLPVDLVARLKGPYDARKVCVTGGAGFIGGHVIDALCGLGSTVSVIDDLSNSTLDHLGEMIELDPSRLRFIHGSILDERALDESMRGCDLVIHLAAVGSVPRSIAEPQRSMAVNAMGTVRVLEAARRAGVRRIVSASSSSVYGDTPGAPSAGDASGAGIVTPRSETQLPAPMSPYAASKLAGEAAVRSWCLCYGMQGASLRFFNVFGPRQSADSAYAAVVPAFAASLLRGQSPVIFGDGQQSRDFTPVASAVAACLLAGATTRELCGQAINIARGERTTILELAQMIALASGAPSIQPTFRDARAGDVRHSLANIAMARALLDYTPLGTMNEAIAETVAFYRQTHNSAGQHS